MDPRRPRDQETQELIDRFSRRRAQKRRLQIIAAVVVFILIAGGVVAAVMTVDKNSGASFGDGGALSDVSSSGMNDPPPTDGSDPSPTSSDQAAAPALPSTTGSTSPESSIATQGTTGTTAGKRTTHTTRPRPTTTVRPTTTIPTTAAKPAAASNGAAGKTVVIDPGHQAKGDYSVEPMGPGSTTNKPKVSSGTGGVVTGVPESRLVLTVALKLRDSLQAHGVNVIMTRTTQDVNISNIERARIANEAGADLFIRIHADGSENAGTKGIHVLYPASIKGWTDDIAAPSKTAASLAQQHLIAATGAKDRGITARGDMTGFNWSDVPVILPEIGFMTNPEEDRLLATDAYQDKIVQGLTRAILEFLGAK